MFRATTTAALPEDVAAFVDAVNGVDDQPQVIRGLFAADVAIFVGRAPGRMDVMGGIADYSGSLVLQMPIREAAVAGVQRETASRQIQLVSLGAVERSESFSFHLDDLMHDGQPVDYEAARAFFAATHEHRWAAYLGGAFLVLMRECGVHFEVGCRILLDSQVPDGKGVSSSAAIEVATMQAICGAFDIHLEPRALALLCQKVENLIVGAPCGVMDQMASACGDEGKLLSILCQPAELLDSVALPEDLTVWGIDSGIRHAVSGADYGSVRTGAFMGLEILRHLAGNPSGVDDLWGGYLANVTPHEWLGHEARIPARLQGADFLASHGGIVDTVTDVDPQRDYDVHPSTAHPILEHQRHRVFAELLAAEPTTRRNELLGELMLQSHTSYSLCGLGSGGTDELVAAVDTPRSRHAGLYGAKITGGGSGGTVAILGAPEALSRVQEIAHDYAAQHGHEPYIFHGSSPGAGSFGILRLDPVA
jgi:galactokinase